MSEVVQFNLMGAEYTLTRDPNGVSFQVYRTSETQDLDADALFEMGLEYLEMAKSGTLADPAAAMEVAKNLFEKAFEILGPSAAQSESK